jgi:hypothetical protein
VTRRLSSGTLRSNFAMRWTQPVVYDILEPGGRYVGRVAAPDSLRLRAIRGDTAWGVIRDSLDVPVVKRYEIRWLRT